MVTRTLKRDLVLNRRNADDPAHADLAPGAVRGQLTVARCGVAATGRGQEPDFESFVVRSCLEDAEYHELARACFEAGRALLATHAQRFSLFASRLISARGAPEAASAVRFCAGGPYSPAEAEGFIGALAAGIVASHGAARVGTIEDVCETLDAILWPLVPTGLGDPAEEAALGRLFAELGDDVTQWGFGLSADVASPLVVPLADAIALLTAVALIASPTRKAQVLAACAEAISSEISSVGDWGTRRLAWAYVLVKTGLPSIGSHLRLVAASEEPAFAALAAPPLAALALLTSGDFCVKRRRESLAGSAFLVFDRAPYDAWLGVRVLDQPVALQGHRVLHVEDWALAPSKLFCSVAVPDPEADPVLAHVVQVLPSATEAQRSVLKRELFFDDARAPFPGLRGVDVSVTVQEGAGPMPARLILGDPFALEEQGLSVALDRGGGIAQPAAEVYMDVTLRRLGAPTEALFREKYGRCLRWAPPPPSRPGSASSPGSRLFFFTTALEVDVSRVVTTVQTVLFLMGRLPEPLVDGILSGPTIHALADVRGEAPHEEEPPECVEECVSPGLVEWLVDQARRAHVVLQELGFAGPTHDPIRDPRAFRALLRFYQKKHALPETGVINCVTLREMDIIPSQRGLSPSAVYGLPRKKPPQPETREGRAALVLTRAARGFLARRHWLALIRSYQADHHTRDLRERNHLLSELLTTERTYVANLDLVVTDYMARPGLFTAEEAAVIFSNIAVIRGVNQRILAALEEKHRLWPSDQALGTTLLGLVPYLKIYSTFFTNYTRSQAALLRAGQQRREVAEVATALAALLIQPVQRVPRYQLLLAQIVKFTSPDHVDRQHLVAALEAVTAVASSLNEDMRAAEHAETLVDLRSRITPAKGVDGAILDNLIQPHRRLILDASGVSFTCTTSVPGSDDGGGSGGAAPRYLSCSSFDKPHAFLLTDVLLLCAAKKASKFKLERVIELSRVFLVTSEAQSACAVKIFSSRAGEAEQECVEITFLSRGVKDKWLERLELLTGVTNFF